jgi:hypothetical protein
MEQELPAELCEGEIAEFVGPSGVAAQIDAGMPKGRPPYR